MKKRIEWIDLCKIITMIIVCYDHTIQSIAPDEALKNSFFIGTISFHMPLFMILSGYFINPKRMRTDKITTSCFSKFKHLMVPAFSWYIIQCCLFREIPEVKASLESYWFLSCLFFCFCILAIITKITTNNLIVFTVACIITYFTPYCYFVKINLLKINEEYEYSNYFLSREMCIQLLSSYFAQKRYVIWQDELEEEEDQLEPPATRVLNWLLKTGWLRKVDDYSTMTVNIVIPDYAAVMIEAFHRLSNEQEDETQIYIQNVYAILFSLKNDSRAGIGLLDTAIINTRKLNKSLQDLLHNMDTFFGSLLEQKDYSQLLKDHLEGYVQEVVNKKYHILKTSDNFYLYKTDIKTWIRSMREDEQWQKRMAEGMAPSMILQKLDQLERGFDDIEHRITNIDREHSRYVKATVTRLGYLLNQEDDMKGLVIQLLNRLSANNGDEDMIQAVGSRMNLSQTGLLSEEALYKQRRPRTDFAKQLPDEKELPELSEEEILNYNKVKNRYSRREIEDFIQDHMENGTMKVDQNTVSSDEDFEKLILAYDYSTRTKSRYKAVESDAKPIKNGPYTYPEFQFVRRNTRE